MKAWLNKNRFLLMTLSFLLMVLPSIPLYYGASVGADFLISILLVLIILGNLLAVVIPS